MTLVDPLEFTERHEWDPKAPYEGGVLLPLPRPVVIGPVVPSRGRSTESPEQCEGMDVLAYPITVHGTGNPGAAVHIHYQGSDPERLPLAWASVRSDGTWQAEVRHRFPSGRNGVVAMQWTPNLENDSVFSDPYYFVIGPCEGVEPPPPERPVDLGSSGVRFFPDLDWRRGALAFRRPDGTWAYGVLRRLDS